MHTGYDLPKVEIKDHNVMIDGQDFFDQRVSDMKTYGNIVKVAKVQRNDYATAIIFIIFWDFLMFYQIVLSPQVKWCAIITYKHGIYAFPHELPNDLRLKIFGN